MPDVFHASTLPASCATQFLRKRKKEEQEQEEPFKLQVTIANFLTHGKYACTVHCNEKVRPGRRKALSDAGRDARAADVCVATIDLSTLKSECRTVYSEMWISAINSTDAA